jgi:ketosteroid isomerase-like protein
MMRSLVFVGPVAALVCSAPALAEVPASAAAVSELLAADRSFSAASAKSELADGLAPMFDDETVMPVPGGFARGKAVILAALKANPANAGSHASWTPVRGGISADGKHGFTLGFMTITADGKPVRNAKYLSYWVRKPEGWRVAVYKRGGRPDGEVSLAEMAPSLPGAGFAPARDPVTLEKYRASLDKAERDFSDLAQQIGLGPAFVRNGSPDATNSGSGPGFTVGNEKIGADVGQGAPELTWAPDGGVIVASTGDLGITWGLIRPKAAPKPGEPSAFPYTTVWRRAGPDQPWRYIAE